MFVTSRDKTDIPPPPPPPPPPPQAPPQAYQCSYLVIKQSVYFREIIILIVVPTQPVSSGKHEISEGYVILVF